MNPEFIRDMENLKALIKTIGQIDILVQQNPECKNVWFERGCDKALQSGHERSFALFCTLLSFYTNHYLLWDDRSTELRKHFVKPFANAVAGDLTEFDGECDGIKFMSDIDFKLLYERLKQLTERKDVQPSDHYAFGILILAAALNNKQNLIPITTGKKKKPNEVKKHLLALGFKEIKKAADAGYYTALYFYVGHLVSHDRIIGKEILKINTPQEKSDYLVKLRECAKKLDDKATYFNVAMVDLKAGNDSQAVDFFSKSLGLPDKQRTAIAHGYICNLSAQSLMLQNNSKEDQKNILRMALNHGVSFFDMSLMPTEDDPLILSFINEHDLLTHIAQCKSKIDELFDAQDPENVRLRCLLYYCTANAYAISGRNATDDNKDTLMTNAFKFIKGAAECKCDIKPRILCLYAHYLLRQREVDEKLVQELLTRAVHAQSSEEIDKVMFKKVIEQLRAHKEKKKSQPEPYNNQTLAVSLSVQLPG